MFPQIGMGLWVILARHIILPPAIYDSSQAVEKGVENIGPP
jgi:hypothetical protein